MSLAFFVNLSSSLLASRNTAMHPSLQAPPQGHLLQNPHRKAQGFPDLYVLDGTIHPKLPQEKASFVRRILIWHQDISAQGVKAFHDLEMQQVIPNVEMEELNGLGKYRCIPNIDIV